MEARTMRLCVSTAMRKAMEKSSRTFERRLTPNVEGVAYRTRRLARLHAIMARWWRGSRRSDVQTATGVRRWTTMVGQGGGDLGACAANGATVGVHVTHAGDVLGVVPREAVRVWRVSGVTWRRPGEI